MSFRYLAYCYVCRAVTWYYCATSAEHASALCGRCHSPEPAFR